eukprot:Em0013g925a
MKSLCERLQRVEVLIGEKERLGTRGASKPTRENDDGKRRTIVCWELREEKAMSHDFAVGADTQNSVRKLPSLSGTSLPHGGRRPVKAQDDKLTVPSLAVIVENISVPLQMQSCPLQQNPIGLIVKEKIVIPAASEVELMVDLATPVAKGTWVVTGNTSARHGVMVAHAVVCPNAKPVPVRVVNPREEIVVLKKGTEIAHMELLEQDPVIEISTVAEKFNISREDQSLLWEMNLGHTKVLQHRIDTGNAQPVHLPPRRIPHARREELKEMLRDMLEKNAIEHSDSPWSSPIVLVKKKDGTTRFCVDYRKVNEVTRKDAYPLPRVDDTLDTLAGSKFFSTLDLTTGYWQVEVAPEDQPKTAFTTPEDYNRRYILDTDASDTGIGAVLSQISDEGSERVIAYASRSLSRRNRDHGSLVWIRNFKEPEGQLARWLEKTSGVQLYRRASSRISPLQRRTRSPEFLAVSCGRENQNVETSQGDNAVITGIGAVLSPFQTCTPNEMRKLQLQDEAIGPVYRAVLDRKTPSADVSKSWSWESRVLMQHWGSLNIQNGVLWRKCIDKCRDYLQLVLPAKLQEDSCSERKAPLQSLRAGYPMQIVCVDIMGPLPETEDGCKYVLVASDCFTRWVEVYGIPNQEATTVAKKLVDEMFCRFSPPEQLHSDQGRQFESELVKEICVLLQIRKTHTTPYHPQCNGMVERFNRTLLDMLATTIDNHQADWQHHIRKLCLAYNSSIHSTTGFSPFFLMFGRQVKLPIDLMYGTNRTGPDTAAGFAQKLKEGLQEAYKLVREKCQAEHKRQKALYDERVHGKPFSPGDLVWLHSPAVPRGRSRKLHHPWKGPLKVVERLGESNYKIKSLRVERKLKLFTSTG